MSKVSKYPFSTPQQDSDLRNASISFWVGLSSSIVIYYFSPTFVISEMSYLYFWAEFLFRFFILSCFKLIIALNSLLPSGLNFLLAEEQEITVDFKKIDSQSFLQQNGFIQKQQKIYNLGHTV